MAFTFFSSHIWYAGVVHSGVCGPLWCVPHGGRHGAALCETATANQVSKPSLYLLATLRCKLKGIWGGRTASTCRERGGKAEGRWARLDCLSHLSERPPSARGRGFGTRAASGISSLARARRRAAPTPGRWGRAEPSRPGARGCVWGGGPEAGSGEGTATDGRRRLRGGPGRRRPSAGGAGAEGSGAERRDGRTAMWTSLGTVTESAGRRAASCRFWAVVLGAAAGVFLVGFLIGTVRSNPPSDRGRGGSPGHPPLFQPGSGLGAGPKGPRVGKERAGFQRPGPCARGARSEGVLGRPTAPALPTLHTGQSPTPPGISSSSAGEGGLCLFDLFRLRLKWNGSATGRRRGAGFVRRGQRTGLTTRLCWNHTSPNEKGGKMNTGLEERWQEGWNGL